MARVPRGIGRAVGRAGLKEDVTVLVNPATWDNLHNGQASLRSYDQSYSTGKAEAGSEEIIYHGSSGRVIVVGHSCVKPSEAWALPLKRFCRVGATDITFDVPGRSDEMFTLLPNNNGYETRSYADQAVLCKAPAKCVKFTGIVNT